jgi:hypothetical protein
MPWKDTPFKFELGDFPNGRHDDCIDAVAGAIHALSPHRIETAGLPVLNKNAVQDHGCTGVDQRPLNDLPQ